MRSLQKYQECKALSLNGDMTHGQHDPRIKEKNEDLQGRPESREGNKSGHRSEGKINCVSSGCSQVQINDAENQHR